VALGLVRVSKMKILKGDFAHYKLNVGEITSALGKWSQSKGKRSREDLNLETRR
jgi:hypothetical protein